MKLRPVVYVIGSLRNPTIPTLGNALETLGWEAFTDWHSAGPNADDEWQKHERARGRMYKEALKGYHAKHVFYFDKHHLDRADAGLLVLPAGKSCCWELGYMAGQVKDTYILFQEYPKDGRWDIMFTACTDVFFSEEEMMKGLRLNGLNYDDNQQTNEGER